MNVNDCFESLRIAYAEWGEFFANRRFFSSDGQISWFNNNVPRHSSILGADEFSRLVEAQQYSFQLIGDGSIFRIFYRFDQRGREVKGASLSFVFAPTGIELCNSVSNGLALEGLCNWIRVDFDPEQDRPPNHSACHLHFSSLPAARLPLSRLPTPRQFISWVMSLALPDEHDVFFAEDQNRTTAQNAPSFTEHWCGGLRNWLHFSVPPYVETLERASRV